MPLEFGDDFCAASEPIAWIWHEGNDPIRCRPIARIVVDVDLQEIQHYQLASIGQNSTHSVSCMECVVASYEAVSTGKKVRFAHAEVPKVESGWGKEGKESTRPPIMTRGEHVLICVDLFLYKRTSASPILPSSCSSPHLCLSHSSAVYSSMGGLDCLACWLCLAPTSFTPN